MLITKSMNENEKKLEWKVVKKLDYLKSELAINIRLTLEQFSFNEFMVLVSYKTLYIFNSIEFQTIMHMITFFSK